MDKVLEAIKQLLEFSKAQAGSPLLDIKRIFVGDPVTIGKEDQPSIIIKPIQDEYDPRGSIYDQKNIDVQILLVYNQRNYFDAYKGPSIDISAASWAGGVASFTSVAAHNLSNDDDITIDEVLPSGYNGTFKATVINATEFSVSMPIDPGIYTSGGIVRGNNIEDMASVLDIVAKVEGTKSGSLEVEDYTIVGTIQKNQNLPNNGINTAAFANIGTVQYTFSKDRGYPTFEVIVPVSIKQVANR